MKTANNLKTNEQAILYNDLVIAFQKYYNENKKILRLGQAFYNFFHRIIYFVPNPNLFYTEDNHKVKKIMENDLVTYVLNECGEKET